MKRAYTKRRRAESEDETRRRIVDAAIALYAARGPADTTISAVATHARVQRLTVYRHFPDERLLFEAAWEVWTAFHPVPPVARWESIADPRQRLRAAFDVIYEYYAASGTFLERMLADRTRLPVLAEVLRPFDVWIESARERLLDGWGLHGRPRRWIVALVDHALRFGSWASLARGESRLDPADAARLLCRAITDIARDPYA